MTSTPNNTLASALNYARLGLRVIPIAPGEKYPKGITNWQTKATNDPTIITDWYNNEHKTWGVGIATGKTATGNHIFVLDIDEHNPHESGSETLLDLEVEHGQLPPTVTVHTPSGGRHLYYRSPKEIRNDAGKRLGKGLDIRGEGGQVLAPPTQHPDGGNYIEDLEHGFDTKPAQAPDWLIHLLTYEPKHIDHHKPATDTFLTGDAPSDRYNQQTNWHDLLTEDGWTYSHQDQQGIQYWTRPGKTKGISASIGHAGGDHLIIFSSNAPAPEGGYSRFGYYAATRHQGNWKHATQAFLATNKTSYTAPAAPTNPTDWPEPLPIINQIPTPNFPLHTLPTWITNHINQTAENLQLNPDLPAQLALGALSVTALGNTHVHYNRDNWTQPLNLYITIACPPSTGKSPAKAAIFKPLEELEQHRTQEARKQLMLHDSQRKILEKQKQELEAKAAKDTASAFIELHQIISDLTELKQPANGRILVDDCTPEALGQIMHNAGGHIAIVTAEGGIFEQMIGVYNDNGSNLNIYLESWGGGKYTIDRITRDPLIIPNANLVIVATIQPAVLDQLGANQQLNRRGIPQRFLFTMPPSNVGNRNRHRTTQTNPTIQTTYHNTIINLANQLHTNPTTLQLEGQAADIFAQWDQQLENQLGEDKELNTEAEWAGKLRASTIRIAALLQLAWHPNTPQTHINTTAITQAIQIAEYYITHLKALKERWGIDQANTTALTIANLLIKHNLDTFTARDIMRTNGRLFKTVDEMWTPIQRLIERDWIRPVEEGNTQLTAGRGKPSPRFAINPHLKDGKLSRMSCMSPKDMFSDNNLSISLQIQGENPPHDKHDKHDNPKRMTTPSESNQTNPTQLDPLW